MRLPFFWIDAFATRIFAGNPAGVVPLDAWLADDLMQRIAAENGLPETAFFVRTGPDRFHLRWFTPAREVDLCGHATVASAFVLFSELGQPGARVIFDSKSGPLPVARTPEGRLELDFPSRPVAPAPAPADLRQGLGAEPEFVGRSRDYLCVFAREEQVRDLRPDFSALARVPGVGVIASAPGRDCDFVSRFFAPASGIPEDPVTGSSHSALIPYWSARLGRKRLHARQVSARGGELFCEDRAERVGIGGHAVCYLRGEISV
ncbi:MAG TPA: PhzF family phenazine biosynthesis protein [Opitutaceae bacterium]|nr:PhzF family phenazine biosynthesis protein [Opitutaceae bacterium]